MAFNIVEETEKLLKADQYDPFKVLGLHYLEEEPGSAVVRTLQPYAESVRLLIDKHVIDMLKKHDDGLFEIIIPKNIVALLPGENIYYRFEITYFNQNKILLDDPYRFLPLLGDVDRHLFNSGTHYELYNRMGAQPISVDYIDGTVFRVWAPTARRVSVVGNFNSWDGRVHQMRVLDNSGIWELFIPDVSLDEPYKYEIRTQSSALIIKTDPYQFYGEHRPKTASIVRDLSSYVWHDEEWLTIRKQTAPYDQPISIYEVHLSSWRRDPADPSRFLTFKEIADQLVPYVKDLGFTHIELMPVMEHPLDESWGYQVTGYFSVSSRYGTPEEFMYLVDLCHQSRIGVILDWVPAHFPTDAHSLARFDGSALYEHEDPRQGSHPEWGTLIFNFGRKEVANFLIANAIFWLDKYHVDGLRVDAVASMLYLDYSRTEGEWLPNYYGGRENLEAIEFMRHMNSVIYEKFPNTLMFAEESTSFYGVSKPTDAGGLGFGFKWNMGWMNDTLNYFSKDPIHRKYHHNSLTFSLYYAFTENFILPLSHDEVVHGKKSLISKMPGDKWQQFANLRLLFLLMWTHPGKKLLFMGGEFGQWSEWYCKQSLDWHLLDEDPLHWQTREYVKEINGIYRANPALWEVDFSHEGFKWMDFNDIDNSIISFARFGREANNHLVCLLNFTPQAHHDYRLPVPTDKRYKEIFNSDYSRFGGSNVENPQAKEPFHEAVGEAAYHVRVSVPPLGGIILKADLT